MIMSPDSMNLIEAPCKAGCEGCYFDDKECPEQESNKPVKEWDCAVKNCIYIQKKNQV